MRCFICLILMAPAAFGQSGRKAKDAKPKEVDALEQAKAIYDTDILIAETAYLEAIAKAKLKLAAAYDVAIADASKRGAEGKDLVNAFTNEKRALTAREESREDLAAALNAKKWYWHWEQPTATSR